MSEIKHTPGPWTAKNEQGMYLVDHQWTADHGSAPMSMSAPVHANGEVIALVVAEYWPEAKVDANAILIAAAPDLLEAIQSVHKRLLRCIELDLSAEEAYDYFYQEIVREAIAKALGEQS